MEEKRDGFLFYRSFYESVKQLNKRDRAAAILGICDYALNGTEPELTGAAASVWILIKPILDANYKRYQNGKRGGRPATTPEPNRKPNENQDETKTEGNKTTRQQGIKQQGIKQQDNTPGGGPSLSEVEGFCLELGGDSAVAAAFYTQYAGAGWQSGGRPIENWRGLLTNFVRGGGGQGGKGGHDLGASAAPGGYTVPQNARKNAEAMRRLLEEDKTDGA